MLAVGRALMPEPKLLLIDEPSAGLSPKMVEQLGETLRQVRASGTAMLMVEQNVGFGLELADEVFVMEKGKVVYQGRSAAGDNVVFCSYRPAKTSSVRSFRAMSS